MAERLINPTNRHYINISDLDLISGVIQNILYRCLSKYPAWINFIRSRVTFIRRPAIFLDILDSNSQSGLKLNLIPVCKALRIVEEKTGDRLDLNEDHIRVRCKFGYKGEFL